MYNLFLKSYRSTEQTKFTQLKSYRSNGLLDLACSFFFLFENSLNRIIEQTNLTSHLNNGLLMSYYEGR